MRKKICFVHYGIGWKDGVNAVIKNLARELAGQDPKLKLCFLGGQIEEKILKGATYKVLPELLPGKKRNLTKRQLQNRARKIAQKLGKALTGQERIIIENPLMGDYHLAAMLGFLFYLKERKSGNSKVFFRVHDLYLDNPEHCRMAGKFFSVSEIKQLLKAPGPDKILIINRSLKNKLRRLGIGQKKMFYLPNGVNEKLFSRKLNSRQIKEIKKSVGIKDKNEKFILYPVRIIPRKNIEEAILLVKMINLAGKEKYSLLLPGKIDKADPFSQKYYEKLKELARFAGFPVIFTNDPFPVQRKYNSKGKLIEYNIGDLYQVAEAAVSTSLQEGFGQFFLESWLAKKIILGRRINEVIRDFEKSGLDFHWLYRDFKGLKPGGFNRRIERIKFVLKSEKALGRILRANEKMIAQQVRVLRENKKIIERNRRIVNRNYNISKVAEKFLKLIQN